MIGLPDKPEKLAFLVQCLLCINADSPNIFVHLSLPFTRRGSEIRDFNHERRISSHFDQH